mmetsp:Transcript_4144/g.6113  ORF Transcript_4144/g.6113 Transcript_4144/m.6113 type:complete len:194 (-) Transcript_4144:32-613(-)
MFIDFTQTSLFVAIASIVWAPLAWNVIARLEHKNKVLTNLAGGNKYYACYGLAIYIFTFSLFRDYLFHRALSFQPDSFFKNSVIVDYLGMICVGVGSILVVSSMYMLGVTGTYLGDYCGILMDSRVEGFPFNVTDNPMYNGSSLVFLGNSLIGHSWAGLFMTAIVFISYKVALRFEEPYTARIYENRDSKKDY